MYSYAVLQGLDVVFDALLCMRQAHGFAFGSSDLFMLCAAKLDPSKQHALDESGRPCIAPCDKVSYLHFVDSGHGVCCGASRMHWCGWGDSMCCLRQ